MLTAARLQVANGLVSRSQGWALPATPWWAWIVLAAPEALLLVVLVASALACPR